MHITTKSEIRTEMKLREREFLKIPGAAARSSEEIASIIEAGEEWRISGTILCYMDISGEVMMKDTVKRWSKAGKRIALPLVCGDTLVLKEYDPDGMKVGYMGISEPREDAVEIACEDIDLAIIPGVAFTREGMRLGRGKGFYDRLLSGLHCHTIGVCFPFRIVPSLPSDPWDVPLNAVITA